MKTSFHDYNIKRDKGMFTNIAEEIINHQQMKLGENGDIGKEEIVEILMGIL